MANTVYQQYPQGPGFMEDAKNVLFKGFELLGTPDAYLRGLMVGSPGKKVWSGRDVLERWGAVGPDQEGLDLGDIGGFALDVLNPLSPTNLLFGWTKALGKGAMAGAKGLGGVSKAAAAWKGAEALAQAKSLLGAAGGAAKAIAPGYAMAMGLPYAGAKLMAHGDERAPWKDALGMGLMTLPLAMPLGMAAMRKGGFKKWSKKNVQEEIARLDAESGVPPQVPKEPWQMSPEEFLATFGVHATDSAASFKPEPRLLEVTRPGQKRFFQGDAVVVRDALGRPIEGQGYNAALPGERASVVSSDPKVVSLYEQGHEALVRDAMARGLSIPDEVVSRYPQLQQARAALQPARRELDFLEQMGIRGVDEQQRVVQAARAQGIADLASDAGAQFVSGVAPPANPLSMRAGMTPQQELMERARAALGVANQGRGGTGSVSFSPEPQVAGLAIGKSPLPGDDLPTAIGRLEMPERQKALWNELQGVLGKQTKGMPKLSIVDAIDESPLAAGSYDFLTHQIKVRSNLKPNQYAETLLHEAVHAATRDAAELRIYGHSKKVPQVTRDAMSRLEEIAYYIRNGVDDLFIKDQSNETLKRAFMTLHESGLNSEVYRGRTFSPEELIPYVFTNKKVQEAMSQIKVPRSSKFKHLHGQSLLQSFVSFVKDLLGIKSKRAVSALEEILGLGTKVMEGDIVQPVPQRVSPIIQSQYNWGTPGDASAISDARAFLQQGNVF